MISSNEKDCATYLLFSINGRNAAISVHHVREVITPRKIMLSPSRDSFMGVIDVRGESIPVMNQNTHLCDSLDGSNTAMVIIFERERGSQDTIALFVDQVKTICDVSAHHIQSIPFSDTGVSDCVALSFRHDNEIYFITDLSDIV